MKQIFITATRFSRQKMVSVASERINFTEAIPSGKLVELTGRVVEVGKSSLKIRVTIVIEDMYSSLRSKAIEGDFHMVAIGDDRRPIPLKFNTSI